MPNNILIDVLLCIASGIGIMILLQCNTLCDLYMLFASGSNYDIEFGTFLFGNIKYSYHAFCYIRIQLVITMSNVENRNAKFQNI